MDDACLCVSALWLVRGRDWNRPLAVTDDVEETGWEDR